MSSALSDANRTICDSTPNSPEIDFDQGRLRGHEDQFSLSKLNIGCRFGQETSAALEGTGETRRFRPSGADSFGRAERSVQIKSCLPG